MYEDVIRAVEENCDCGKVVSLKKMTGGLNNDSWKGTFEQNGKQRIVFVRVWAPRKEGYEIRYESGLMEHLKEKGMKVNAQFLLSKTGDLYVPIYLKPQVRQYLVLQEWLEGEDAYFWAESSPRTKAIKSAVRVVAQLHGYADDYCPEEGVRCKEPVFQEQLKHHAQDFDLWSHALAQDHFKQNLGQYMLTQLDYVKKMISLTDKLWKNQEDLPVCNIHTDTHLGNFKFVDDEVTAIFDFDWAKRDVRLYDVAMAGVTFCTSWFYDRHGAINTELLREVLYEYNQEILRTKARIGQLQEREAELLPIMMVGTNLYIMRDLLRQIYENRELSDFEYLFFMIHQIECFQWIEKHYEEIIKIAKESIIE